MRRSLITVPPPGFTTNDRSFAMPKEYARTTFHGKATDYRTAVMARQVEKHLGVTFICWQGSYNSSVDASAGTHAGGGALDLSVPGDPDQVTRALRKVGFAAWYRTPAQGFSTHIHAIDIGNDRLHPDARAQVVDYRNGGNGLSPLVGDDDPQPYRPDPIRGFNFDKWQREQTLRDQIGSLSSRIKELARKRKQARNRLEKLS